MKDYATPDTSAIEIEEARTAAFNRGKPAPVVPAQSNLIAREVSFGVEYDVPGSSEHLSAILVSVVPDGEGRNAVSRMAAIRSGVPWESLPPFEAARFYAQSWVAIQLKDPPPWVLQWITQDDNLLFMLNGRLAEHRKLFFRADGGEGDGAPKPSSVVLHPFQHSRSKA